MAVGAILSGVASAMNIAGGVVNALGATSGSQMLGGVQQVTGTASSMLSDTNKQLMDENKMRLEYAKLNMREKQNETRMYTAETQRKFIDHITDNPNAGMHYEMPTPTQPINSLVSGAVAEQKSIEKIHPLMGGMR